MDLRATLYEDAERIDTPGNFAAAAITIEGRAHRRRVAAAALGGALALAVSAPLVYSAMTPETSKPVPATSTTAPVPTTSAPAPTQKPTMSATPTAIPTFDTGAKPLAIALPKLGPATGTPDVPYAVDGVLHDGAREVPLPAKTGIWELATLDHGGALVLGNGETGTGLSLVDATGKALGSLAPYQTVRASDDGSRLLAAGNDGVLKVLDSKGAVVAEKRTPHVPVALVGDLAFAQGAEGPDSIVWNTVTGETRPIKGIVRDASATQALVLVLESQATPDPSRTCYSLLDLHTLAKRSQACGPIAPIAFSPRGTYLIGTGTFDGAGPITLAVVRADDGRVALRVDESVGAWTYRMNEAETALTFSASPVESTTNNALVRCDLTGACTVVGDSRNMPIVNGLPETAWSVTQN
jgi:hypothetical protein